MQAGNFQRRRCVFQFFICMNHPYCFGVIRTAQGSLYESCELEIAQLGHSYCWFLHMDRTSVDLAENVAGLIHNISLYRISDQM